MKSIWVRNLFIAVILFGCIGCDQVTKEIAREHLQYKPAVSLLGSTVMLLYTHNPGVAFSIGANWSPRARFMLTIVGAGAGLLFILGILLLKAPDRRAEILGFSLMLGGGLSNFIDRILREQGVVDFMMIQVGEIRTAIFNVADMLVLLGVAVVGVYAFKEGRRVAREEGDSEE